MDIETRVKNLEDMLASIINTISNSKFYTDADISGTRQSISNLDTKVNDTLMPAWNPNGYNYFASERVSYNGKYYRCIQNHTSQTDWTPDTAVSLWVEISDPAIEYPEWVQPTGAHDAYAKGDKVSHNDKHWTSDIDANVYEPGVYGWTEV